VRRGETHYLYAYVSHSHGADDGAEWASIRCWTRAWTSDGDLRCGGSGCYRCGLSDACTAHLVSFLLVGRFPVANMEGGTLWIVVSLFMSYVLNFGEFPFRNCLENSWKASRRCVVGAGRGRRVVYLPLLAALQDPLRDSFRISKQFLQAVG
jgi:hypothetical protein